MKTIHSFALLSCLAAATFATPLRAQSITGTIEAINHNYYAGIASQFQISGLKVDGETIYNGSGYLFCADLIGKSLDEDSKTYPREAPPLKLGTMDQLEVWNRFSNFQDERLAQATAHWFIDNFYESEFLNPAKYTQTRQYAFQNVLWEIYGDAGTYRGLNLSDGNINRSMFGPSGTNSQPGLWGYMNSYLESVKNSGVTSAYESKFEVLVALDPRSDHQDYLMLSADPQLMAVPEPSCAIVALLSGMLMLTRRRR